MMGTLRRDGKSAIKKIMDSFLLVIVRKKKKKQRETNNNCIRGLHYNIYFVVIRLVKPRVKTAKMFFLLLSNL